VSPRGQVSDGIDNMGTHRRPRLLGIDFPVHVAVAKGGVHGGARPQAITPLRRRSVHCFRNVGNFRL
jgi:hypothetical protein